MKLFLFYILIYLAIGVIFVADGGTKLGANPIDTKSKVIEITYGVVAWPISLFFTLYNCQNSTTCKIKYQPVEQVNFNDSRAMIPAVISTQYKISKKGI